MIIPTIESLEDVFETMDDSLATKVQNRLQTSEGREVLQADLGSWVKSTSKLFWRESEINRR